jgi:transposase-like protein
MMLDASVVAVTPSSTYRVASSGAPGARKMKRAQILLMADAGQTDEAIAQALHVGTSTVYRTKRRFVEESSTSIIQRQTF